MATDVDMRRAGARGFTLIELIITLTIVGLMATLAVPSFWSIIVSNRATSITNSLVSDLYLARSEAIKRVETVTICKYTTTEDGAIQCNGDASWEDGWVIFTDPDSNEAIGDGETIIRVHNALADTVILDYDQDDAYISFLPTGRTTNEVATSHFSFCDTDNSVVRQVTIHKTGRVRAEKEEANFSETSCG